MEISIFLASWCNAFGNISPIHFSPPIPSSSFAKKDNDPPRLLLLQAVGLGTRG